MDISRIVYVSKPKGHKGGDIRVLRSKGKVRVSRPPRFQEWNGLLFDHTKV